MKKKGRGQGEGNSYLPYVTVRDITSHGLSTRVCGWKTGRVHHFLSKLELSFFYVLEWSNQVTDIREKYPLPAEATLEIAHRIRVKHPALPKTSEPTVMMTDFLIDIEVNGQPKLAARNVVPEKQLHLKRTIEKLSIERLFWEEKGIDFGIVTEHDIPYVLSKNVAFLHKSRDISFYPHITVELINFVEPVLRQTMHSSSIGLANGALMVDHQFGLMPGTSLTIVKHLIAIGMWEVDMSVLIDTAKPLQLRKSNFAREVRRLS